MDGFAIAGFVLALIGGILFGLVFGIVGIVRTQGGQRRGRGLAVAAIIISMLWAALIAVVIVIVIATSAERSGTGDVTRPGSESFEDVREGDCVSDVEQGVAFSLEVVPCDQPHKAEVYAIFDLPDTPYPGASTVTSLAESGCNSRLPTSLSDGLDVYYYYPQESNWDAGDRAVLCLVGSDSALLNEKVLPA